MNTVIWTTFFTAAGAVGAAAVTAVFAYRTQTQHEKETRRQAEQASADAAAAAVADRRRDAYSVLVGTARYWQTATQEIQKEFSEGLPKDLNIDRSRILVQDLAKAVARVELIGTDAARSGAEAIYAKSKAIGEMYADFESQRSEATKNRWRHIIMPKFNSHSASEAIKKLEAEIKSFLECVRPGAA